MFYSIKNELELDKNSIAILNDFAITGQSQLCNLASHNADLESLPHYKEAILKVSTFFDEVCRLLNKYDKESVKLTQLFPQIIQVKKRYEEFYELIDYFENDAQQILQDLNIRPNSVKDARSLLDEFLRTENTIFESILTRFEKLADKNNVPGDDAVDRTLCSEILRKAKMIDLSVLEGKLRNLVENFKLQKDLIKNSIQICEICYQLCDEAYEWALDCLKFASSLKRSLSNLPKMENSLNLLDNETSRKTLATLGKKLMQHLANNPKNKNLKMEKMKEIADELQDERLILQCRVRNNEANVFKINR
uniref:Uncharacterized protein n=1 Tax=Romanomermis culicivorax TaxID=13658 RepID=A0A915HYJ0_ROMCU